MDKKIVFNNILTPASLFKDKPSAGFLDKNYYRTFKAHHQGADYNSKYGGDSDLGWPIRLPWPGRVRHISAVKGRGITVIIKSEPWVVDFWLKRLGIEGEAFDPLFMHLHSTDLQIGELLPAGAVVGTVGKGARMLGMAGWFGKRYVAHLHFEIRIVDVDQYIAQYGRTEKEIRATHIDPELVFKNDFEDVSFEDRTNLIPSFEHRSGRIRYGEIFGNSMAEKDIVATHIDRKLYVRFSDTD